MFDYLPFSEINKTSAQIVADILKCKKVSVEERDKDQWNIVLPPNLEVKRYKNIIDWFLNPENHNLDAKAEFNIMGLNIRLDMVVFILLFQKSVLMVEIYGILMFKVIIHRN